jgi:hypothetical protein
MMLAELSGLFSKAEMLAAFSECATPKSSACNISSFASAAYPKRSEIDLFCVYPSTQHKKRKLWKILNVLIIKILDG